jgi:hypothetical protein
MRQRLSIEGDKMRREYVTAHRRWKGKNFDKFVAEFGEDVLYLKANTAGREKFEHRCESGVYLGRRDESHENIIRRGKRPQEETRRRIEMEQRISERDRGSPMETSSYCRESI